VIDNASNLYVIYYPSASSALLWRGLKIGSPVLGGTALVSVLATKEELVINTGKICVGSTGVYELVNFPRRKVGA